MERSSAAERNGLVIRAVERLSPKLRIAFVLRHVEDMSAVEVARTLGVASGTVRSRVHEARRRLTADLGEEFRE